jgi:hypothetical protein
MDRMSFCPGRPAADPTERAKELESCIHELCDEFRETDQGDFILRYDDALDILKRYGMEGAA